MVSVRKLSPRVVVYDHDAVRPLVNDDVVTLPCLPSKVFGDGSHPTTRLCAGAVDYVCRTKVPRSFLDVGTGNGVLARIARARGVPRVVATDIDDDALVCARANIVLDPYATSIEVLNALPSACGTPFDVVVANILEGPLVLLAPEFKRALTKDGVLLISGFTKPQVPNLRACFQNEGFTSTSLAELDGWCLLTFGVSDDADVLSRLD